MQASQWFQTFTGPLFEIKLYSLETAPQELWNPLSKAVPGKFLRSGEPSKQLFARQSQFSQVSGKTNYPNL